MSIEADSQNDLALNAEDAENVVGGKMNKKKVAKKKTVAHKTAARSTPLVVNIPGAVTATESSYVDDCGDTPAVAADSAASVE